MMYRPFLNAPELTCLGVLACILQVAELQVLYFYQVVFKDLATTQATTKQLQIKVFYLITHFFQHK